MTLQILQLGPQPYRETWEKMRQFTRERSSKSQDALWILEHFPVITAGSRCQDADLPNRQGIETVRTDRGGLITVHSPGQVVLYAMIDLRRRRLSARQFVLTLLEGAQQFLQNHGIHTQLDGRQPGLYVDTGKNLAVAKSKIASIGIRISRGCSYHGISVNINPDLTLSNQVVTCGQTDIATTSMAALGVQMSVADASEQLATTVARQLQRQHPILLKARQEGQQIKAVIGGVKSNANSAIEPMRKPAWLRKALPHTAASLQEHRKVRSTLNQQNLVTVCQEARCPNRAECWSRGTATFMLLGDLCSRACKFCSVATGNPQKFVDHSEPFRVANAVKDLDLRYVVLTSVNRDDLLDGGSSHFAITIETILRHCAKTQVEALIPDFKGDLEAVSRVATAGLRVLAHNLETVRSLTPKVRDPRATYDQSLTVLRHIATHHPRVVAKSALMLGLGETADQLKIAFDDLVNAGVQILTLGQYLRPTRHHLPVARWLSPEEFAAMEELATAHGLQKVIAGPWVRSSYRAEEALQIPLHAPKVATDSAISINVIG